MNRSHNALHLRVKWRHKETASFNQRSFSLAVGVRLRPIPALVKNPRRYWPKTNSCRLAFLVLMVRFCCYAPAFLKPPATLKYRCFIKGKIVPGTAHRSDLLNAKPGWSVALLNFVTRRITSTSDGDTPRILIRPHPPPSGKTNIVECHRSPGLARPAPSIFLHMLRKLVAAIGVPPQIRA